MSGVGSRAANLQRVYVIELARDNIHERLPPLYVGSSGVSPDVRFRQHAIGFKAARGIRERLIRLRPELYEGLPTQDNSQSARELERSHAERLALAGHPVRSNGSLTQHRPRDQRSFTREELEPVIGLLDRAILIIVAAAHRRLSRGLCAHILYGSTGSAVAEYRRLPEFATFAHVEHRVLRERVEELIDQRQLELVTVGPHRKLLAVDRAIAGSYNDASSYAPSDQRADGNRSSAA